MEYLGQKKFHKCACCNCDIQLHYNVKFHKNLGTNYMAKCLILYMCGNRTENAWIQRIRGYFGPYGVGITKCVEGLMN